MIEKLGVEGHKMERGCGRWWRDITCSLLTALFVACMASLWVLISAQAAAPPTTSPCYLYSRDLVTTVWDFILTLVALTVDDWGSHKNEEDTIFFKVLTVLWMGTLNPFGSLTFRMEHLMKSMTMMKRLSNTPSAKPYIKTLSGCQVVVNMSPATCEKLRHLDTFKDDLLVEDFSDALVIGRPVHPIDLLQLTDGGKEALLRTEVLPPVEQLKILRGYSGLAIAASAIQALGYIYGIIVRLAQGLRVSPLEAIAFILNVLVLMKAMLHFYSSSCHRPLVLFLEADEETKFTIKCEGLAPECEPSTCYEIIFSILWMGGIAILPGGLSMFFIIKIANVTSLSIAIPLIVVEGIIIVVCSLLLLINIDFIFLSHNSK